MMYYFSLDLRSGSGNGQQIWHASKIHLSPKFGFIFLNVESRSGDSEKKIGDS
jgi:hypothetical protein